MKHLVSVAFLLAALGLALQASAKDKQPVIAANSTVNGQFDKSDTKRDGKRIDTYAYDAQAGDELRLGTGPSSLDMRIEGPGKFVRTGNGLMTVRLPKAGRYQISVMGNLYGNAFYAYSLTVTRVITEQLPAALRSGQSIEAGISSTDTPDPKYSTSRMDLYTYDAKAGEAVSFRFSSPHNQVQLRMFGPDGSKRFALASATESAELAAYFNTAGVYQIFVSSNGGNYALSVQPRKLATDATPIAQLKVGDSVVLTPGPDTAINANDQWTHVFTLEAQEGDRLAFVRPMGGTVKAIGPDGRPVKLKFSSEKETYLSSTELVAPFTGRYRIEVDGGTGDLKLMDAVQGAITLADAAAQGAQKRAEKEARIAAFFDQGDRALNSGDNKTAYEAYNEVLKLTQGDVRAKTGAGLAAYRDGNTFGARFNFQSVLIYDPGNKFATEMLVALDRADADAQRQQQLANEQYRRDRERERQETISNALGAFAAGAAAGAEINAQQRAAPTPQPAYTPTYTSPPPVAPPAAPSVSSSTPVNRPSFLDPKTGQQCVQQVRLYTTPRNTTGGVLYNWEFKNICDAAFTVRAYRKVLVPGSMWNQSEVRAYPHSVVVAQCYNDPGNPEQACTGFERYEVRY